MSPSCKAHRMDFFPIMLLSKRDSHDSTRVFRNTGYMATNSSEEVSPSLYFFLVVSAVDHTVGVPANCWALWLIISGRRQLLETELLTLNLMAMELLCSACFVFTAFYVTFSLIYFHFIAHFYVSASVVARVLFQCHICVDRYLAVLHPLTFVRYKKMRYRGACLTLLWLAAFSMGLSNSFSPFNSAVVLISSFGLLVPSLCIELFCSLQIVRTLRRPGPGDRDTQDRSEGNRQKRKAVNIIFVVLTMLIINVVPFVALPFVDVSQGYVISFTLSSVGSSAQAFLFLSRSRKLLSNTGVPWYPNVPWCNLNVHSEVQTTG